MVFDLSPIAMANYDTESSNALYNWHPAVHSGHFDETLYFVMIRLREPLHRPVAEQIRDLLKAAGIKYACAYPLFGWWDALLRVWLTSISYNRLVRVLDESIEHSVEHNVEDYRGFTTSSIHYFWHDTDRDLLSPDKKTKAAIASNNAAIEEVAENPEETDTEAWRSLKDAKLLFARPSLPKGSVKFYTCLERTSDIMTARREKKAIMRAMDATLLGDTDVSMTERSSLYCGSGSLAAYLVRCVADSFDDVLALAESFDIHLKDTGLRPMTLLVANPNAVYESDYVNDTLHLSPGDNKTVDLLDVDEKIFAKLPPHHRQELNDLAIEACELSRDDDALRGLLLKILVTTALDSHDEFQASLSFLLNFEPEFKRRLIREFADVFGKNWLVEIRVLCEDSKKRMHQEHAKKEMSKDLKEWTLGTYIYTAHAVSSLRPDFRGRLESQLGVGWGEESDQLLALRNDLSHGRVLELSPLGVYDEAATSYLRRTMKAGVFWWRSRDKSSSNETKKGS